jgi:myo-inositol-1(or 4)-monophosphatase
MLHLPNSMFIIGLAENGKLLMSVAYDPFNDKMYHAFKGAGAYCNNKQIHVNSIPIAEGYPVIGNDSIIFGEELKKRSLGVEPVPGTGFKCMMIASGRGLGMINDSADFHDIGPCSLIVEEAGGKVTGLHGEELDYTKELSGVIVSNGVVHKDFLEIAAMHAPVAATA